MIAGGAIALRLRRRGPLAPPKLSATPPEAEPPANAPTVNILLVHASADDATCRDLVTHLQPLEARKRICMCLLRDLDGGAPIERSLAERMAWADVFLLAVSKNFFADEATCVPAMNRALERHAKDGAVILPVVLASFLIKETPLADFTPLPEQGRPVDQWPTKDAALVNIAEGVKGIVAAIHARRAPKPPPAL